MKVLVAYASKHGATAEIAAAIGFELGVLGIDAEVKPAWAVTSVGEYDAVVLGSGIYAGHWLSDATDFAVAYGPALENTPMWLFSSGPIGDPPLPADDAVDLKGVLGAVTPVEHRVFAGRLVRKDLGFFERTVAAVLRAPDGDFRDWDAVRDWSGQIAEALCASQPVRALEPVGAAR